MMVETTPAPGPLAGLRVIELCDEKGAFAGKLMADMGAEVIKVEPPSGDITRTYPPFAGDQPDPERSLWFWHYNTSKRGVTIDLGKVKDVARVVVHQYGPAFVMTDYDLATSVDNKQFDVVARKQGDTPVELVIDFPKRKARYLRITSYASKNPTYPTTFFEIEAGGADRRGLMPADPVEWRQERGLRALGALGGSGAGEAILEVLGPVPTTAGNYRPTVRAGIRALGRLRDEAGFRALIALLENPFWARHAADALGDFGDRRAVAG